jgi:hypothetical protein
VTGRLSRGLGVIAHLPDVLAGVRYVRALLRDRTDVANVRAVVRARTERREAAFLEMVERAIFAYPDSPYRPMLAAASVDWPGLLALVGARGVEGALETLAARGVYVSIEEYKGTRECRRSGMTWRFTESTFRNPLITSGLVASSGGTRSQGLATTIAPSNHRLGAEHLALALEAYGLRQAPVIVWLAYTHGASLWAVLALLAAGHRVPFWFSLLPPTVEERSGVYARYVGVRAAVLLHGRRIPPATHLPIGQEATIVDWLANRRGPYGIFTTPSTALRLALAAARQGATLEHVTFITIAEPLTAAKLAAVHAVRARAFSSLGFTEIGRATYGCAAAPTGDDGHVCRDAVAVIQHRRTVDRLGTEIDALLLTALQPDARKIFLNMETGDYANVAIRRCGCPLETLGWTEHLSEIRSFEKLNAEGPPFSGAKLIALVEEILPRRFGGDPTDYQLLEEEDHEGFTRLSILVHPRLGALDESAVLACAAETLWTTHGPVSTQVWTDAHTVRVRRGAPMLTRAGKCFPLHHLIAPQSLRAGPPG